ncbi:multinuclear nonheme iron-dependent oxidase [Taibaiella koreensis]|uniref:multinuclear nonheme iron-dependent oxidase n=1 Tax=Taibaiella koreensis TaxID=1268548 RepID=UPI000E59E456|nr:DUF692 family multinuclear iron-containing protein [Taibaiella koreensis]
MEYEPLRSTIACNLDAGILSASLPLFEEARVEAIEWAFDTLFRLETIPVWFEELLEAFSKEKRLIGHGVFFSLFSGRWQPEQQRWLDQLRTLCRKYHFDHITEHFGFMTGADFHHGAPLGIPFTAETLALGRDRLARIYDACQCPVGLENLAFSYSLEEVERHGAFLEELLQPLNGFIILDLHNLYCQLHNFSLDFDTLIKRYPLHRVREIHISGGSWEPSALFEGKSVRRDTHDDTVPEEVFVLLEKTIPLCPCLKYVVMEQLGTGLATEPSRQAFRNDFIRMQQIVSAATAQPAAFLPEAFLPPDILPAGPVVESATLHNQQLELSAILESSAGYEDARQRLAHSSLAGTGWQVEAWQPHMLETAVHIAQKWRKKNT